MVKLPSGWYFSERKVATAKWNRDKTAYVVQFSGCDKETYFCQEDGFFIESVLDSCTLDYVQKIGEGG